MNEKIQLGTALAPDAQARYENSLDENTMELPQGHVLLNRSACLEVSMLIRALRNRLSVELPARRDKDDREILTELIARCNAVMGALQ